MPVTLALRSKRQEDQHQFKTNRHCIVRLSQKTSKQKKESPIDLSPRRIPRLWNIFTVHPVNVSASMIKD